MSARSLMVLGTASHVGKSMLTTALCRIFARAGIRVAPFKAQNMSLNSAATVDGFEIGRAQALQAEAAGLFATRDMNPILLKPDSSRSCQIVVQGRVWKTLSAGEYHLNRVKELFPFVLESYHRLADEYELLLLEGAGSPAEINLKDSDIVNMRMADAADASCLLVADIDRGGVFASLLGTLELLDPGERDRIRGFAINKFRGDLKLLAPGIVEIEKRLRKPCIGVVPFLRDLDLDEEDSVGLSSQTGAQTPATASWEEGNSLNRQLRVAVIKFPFLSNFTDFDALKAEPGVSLRFVDEPLQMERADLIILPGTKQTIADFRWLNGSGLAAAIVGCRDTKLVVGICGGMQMMGLTIEDPHFMEGGGKTKGLGLLGIHTTLSTKKVAAQARVSLTVHRLFGISQDVRDAVGYEIHLGETTYEARTTPLFELRRYHAQETVIQDGAQSSDRRCFGTYLHGLFDDDSFRHALLNSARVACRIDPTEDLASCTAERQKRIDRLADAVEQALDINALRAWIHLPPAPLLRTIAETAAR